MSGTPGEIDKKELYAKYQDQQDKELAWKTELAKQVTHKALDIPVQDDVNIHAPKTITNTTTTTGIGVKGIVATVLAATGIPAAALTAWMVLGNHGPAPTIPPPATTAIVPAVAPLPAKDWNEYEAVYQVRQADGSWKEVKREPLKGMK